MNMGIQVKFLLPSLLLFIFPFDALNAKPVKKVEIQTVLADSTLNVRSIEVVRGIDEGCVFVTSDGNFGALYNSETGEIREGYAINYPIPVSEHFTDLNFRSLALTTSDGFAITIGNPALLFNLDRTASELVYREDHEDVFYDSIEFWNENEGLAIGDPTDACMSIIITRDGGESWKKLNCSNLPVAIEGEAAFAASDTNIAIIGDHTWVATGGKASRILYSPDKGKNWEVFNTPIIQGEETTGIYSIDFYDDKIGYAIGGDYTKPGVNTANKIRTMDGGRKWELVPGGPGYRSCVQYVPESDGKELVAVGFEGIDYSNDGGLNWIHLSDEGFYTIRFAGKRKAYAAGKGKVAILRFK